GARSTGVWSSAPFLRVPHSRPMSHRCASARLTSGPRRSTTASLPRCRRRTPRRRRLAIQYQPFIAAEAAPSGQRAKEAGGERREPRNLRVLRFGCTDVDRLGKGGAVVDRGELGIAVKGRLKTLGSAGGERLEPGVPRR